MMFGDYDFLWYFLFAILGLHVGSFLNVVIDRLPEGESIVKGRSHCDYCKKTLQWWELLPVFSYLLQRGKCRSCGKALSWQYPAIELLTSVVFVLFIYSFPYSISDWFVIPRALSLLFFLCAMIAIALIDYKKGIIPDGIVLFLVWLFALRTIVELALGVFLSEMSYHGQDLLVSINWQDLVSQYSLLALMPQLQAALFAGLFFYILVLITRGRGMGGGDVKLAFVMGLFLPPMQTFLSVYLSFLLGGLVAVWLLVWGKRKFGQTVPFGPFLVIGSMIAVFWGSNILSYFLWL